MNLELPVLLIEKFAELVMNGQSEKQDIALGVDVRSGEELPYLETIIRKWRENKYPFSILFLDSSDEVLIKRFKETRRSHPLSRTGRVEKGIEFPSVLPESVPSCFPKSSSAAV